MKVNLSHFQVLAIFLKLPLNLFIIVRQVDVSTFLQTLMYFINYCRTANVEQMLNYCYHSFFQLFLCVIVATGYSVSDPNSVITG